MIAEAWDLCDFCVKPSAHDVRDRKYAPDNSQVRQSVDLREWDSLVEDQGYLGSCTANSITNCYELLVKKLYPEYFTELSRLFVYYNARTYDNTTAQDSGVTIKDGLRGVKQYGVCSESLWPYNPDNFFMRPSVEAYADAEQRTITNYEWLSGNSDIMEVVNLNKPVLLGILVYTDFLSVSADNPVVPMPADSDVDVGGHAVSIVGYDLDKQQFLIKNSYGSGWGDQGYGWLPFEYVNMYSFEKWYFDISDPRTNSLIEIT